MASAVDGYQPQVLQPSASEKGLKTLMHQWPEDQGEHKCSG
jgi:hypothetical protein